MQEKKKLNPYNPPINNQRNKILNTCYLQRNWKVNQSIKIKVGNIYNQNNIKVYRFYRMNITNLNKKNKYNKCFMKIWCLIMSEFIIIQINKKNYINNLISKLFIIKRMKYNKRIKLYSYKVNFKILFNLNNQLRNRDR